MSEWISVDDRLPRVEQDVLWFDGDKTMVGGSKQIHIDKILKNGECIVNYLHNYTHWMPLPEPPKTKPL